MEAAIGHRLAELIALAQTTLQQVVHETDITPARAILRLQGQYKGYRVVVREIVDGGQRKYAYYVLRGSWVEVGFDNSADPDAIRLKYGVVTPVNRNELTPHMHRADKTILSLTDELTLADFLAWLRISEL